VSDNPLGRVVAISYSEVFRSLHLESRRLTSETRKRARPQVDLQPRKPTAVDLAVRVSELDFRAGPLGLLNFRVVGWGRGSPKRNSLARACSRISHGAAVDIAAADSECGALVGVELDGVRRHVKVVTPRNAFCDVCQKMSKTGKTSLNTGSRSDDRTSGDGLIPRSFCASKG
jgi:hypothetical protein